MKALVMTAGEGPRGVKLADAAPPTCGPDEVRVGVKASALNRADLLQTMGLYPAPKGVPADIPGLEYAGEVLEVGARVTRWKAGDRVMGLLAGGAWAEQIVTHEREAMAVPPGLSFSQAAAVPEAFITAWDAMVLQGGLRAGQTVLVHAVASGVGTAALQLCAMAGARCLGTGRSAAKLERARAIGRVETVLVDGKAPAFAEAVKGLTGGRGAELVLDLVGGDWLPETIDALAPQGTLMLVGLVAGASAEVPLRTVLGKRLRVIGTTLRARALEEKIAVARAFEQLVLPQFSTGALNPVVEQAVSFSDAAGALERLAANDTFGKTILTW